MKLLFVSNRLPYYIAKTDTGDYESRLSVSGLVSGVQSIFKEREGVWLGWGGDSAEVLEKNHHLVKEWEKENYFAVPIPNDILVNAHENFNNRSLWSLFHYFIDFVDFQRADWEAYKLYNQIFADAVIEHYNDGDTVFINDFQLMLVPALLRKALPNAHISYFHHITFPTSDIFERLPVAKELLSGVLGADSVGFHTKGHVKSFERAVKRMGLELGRTHVEANPIGIDPFFWEETLKTPETKMRAKWMKACFSNKKIILATERLDYTKGIKERIKAYDYLLEAHPEVKGEVILVQVAVSTRQGIPIYEDIAEQVHKEVGRMKGKYERLDWRPMYYTNKGFSQEELCALYSISEVACVTPLIDGLNLVSKEYTLSGGNDRALILSKFAGSVDELPEAYVVNPYNIEEVGEAMFTALSNPNVEKLKKAVKANTIFDWADRALNKIK